MKKYIYVSILFFMASCCNAEALEQESDMYLIERTLNTYLNGHIKGDKNILGKAMHCEGKLSYLRSGEYKIVEFPDYLSRMKLRDTDDGIKRIPYIKSIEVRGDVAVGKLMLDYSSIVFTDYMTLLKINGEWKITNKIAYSLRDPNNSKAVSANIKDIKTPLEQYLMAYKTGDIEYLQKAFHAESKIMSVQAGKFTSLKLETFIGTFKLDDGKNAKHLIERIDATGNVAIGKVIHTYQSAIITSYLSLLNIDGHWKIVNMAFNISDT